MRKFLFTTLALLIASTILIPQEDNNEFRAMWVITWEHINPYSSTETNKARVRKIMDNLKKANMNAVLWQARQSGTAYYNSSYEPWGKYAGYNYPGYDPLQYAIEEAHKRGIEVHAWFNVFHCSSTYPGAPAAEHPEWVCRDGNGNPMPASRCLSPGLKEVRDYLVNVAMEIVNNYDIDGLHLDFVRWNEYTVSDLSGSGALGKLADEDRMLDGMITRERAERLRMVDYSQRYLFDVQHPYSAGVPSGFSSWEEWWRWSVTEFVKALHDSIQKVKPWVRLSVAALGRYNWGVWNGYYDVFQDAALWFNEGYIEQLTPMHYHWTTPDGFYGMLEGNCPDCWKEHIQEGINAGRLYTVGPGSYIFQEENVWYRHPQIVETCRNVSWTDGFQFFSYRSWDGYDYWETAGQTFFGKLTKIRPIKLIDSIPPDPAEVSLQKIDSLNYELTVHLPDTLSHKVWVVVYRTPNTHTDPAHDEIILRAFTDTNIVHVESFTGTQDFNGIYHYYAALIDRYWNESQPSNVEASDSIPSFPPVVLSHFPESGETVKINIDITISFSKTMDINSVNDAITITPEKRYTLLWSDDHKTLTIDLIEPLDYDCEHTITISASARDINGKALDGNGDGIPGDPYSFSFYTTGKDEEGPVVVSSLPDFRTHDTHFDIENAITIEFDEIIDESCANTGYITLKNYKGPVDVDFHHYLVEDNTKSVISLRPYEALIPFLNYEVIISEDISDTLGNISRVPITISFKTDATQYDEIIYIDDFTQPGGWWEPEGSGSTAGVYTGETNFGVTSQYYLPGTATRPVQKRAAFITYKWKEEATLYLLREYLPEDDPKNKEFDKSYTLQCFVFGDNSKNKFRFAIDEAFGTVYAAHEVSKWVTIDWYGWKLIEWDLSDPDTVGRWDVDGNNGKLDGDKYRFDSIQLTKTPEGKMQSVIYIDELRIVKKSPFTAIKETYVATNTIDGFRLHQNYPNPFNSSTTISFEIPEEQTVSLIVYNLKGAEVYRILHNRKLSAGRYKINFNSRSLSSGEYIYVLRTEKTSLSRKMVIIK